VKKRLILFLTVLMLIALAGCFNNSDKDKISASKGLIITESKDGVTVTTEKKLLATEIELAGNLFNSNVVITEDYLNIIQEVDGKKVLYISNYGEEKNITFELKNVKHGKINLVKELSESAIISDKVNKRSGEKLLGDFNGDNIVNMQDFSLFQTNFGKNVVTYDIGPATKGSGDWAGIFAFSNGDGVVGLEDLAVFAVNFGKEAPEEKVEIIEVSSVSLSVTKTKLEVGETINATATISPSNAANKTITWSVSDSNVISINGIDEVGVITAKAAGTSTVTIRSANGKSNSITITVEKKEEEKITGIEVYAKFSHIWAWGKNGSGAVDEFSAWPGQAMEDATGDWKKWYFADAKSIELIFSNGGNGKTGDLTISEEGRYWYVNGKFVTSNPDQDTEAPKVSILPKAKKEEGTTLYYEDATLNITLDVKDNQDSAPKAYYTTDGTTPSITSTLYTGATIAVTDNMTIKVFAIDKDNNSTLNSYTFKLNQDTEAPVVTASPDSGRFTQGETVKVTLTVKDNKDSNPKIYYTTNGDEPIENFNLLYNGSVITVTDRLTIKTLAVDASGNKSKKDFNYSFASGNVTTTRFDPRQESIYFLLPTRWFDGDPANTVGDEWCSYTEERVTPGGANYMADHGFTGPDDVTWRGDFKGLVEKMDYIKALGFTAIWITPVVQNRGPLCYHGYHGWDFTREDPRLESPGYDFQRVIDEAHARDMKICLDIVINHSGRYGIKNFAEVQYARDPNMYPVPDGWENFKWDEARYQAGLPQNYPNGWQYDGLTSPGTVNGKPISPSASFTQDVRPFTDANIAKYPGLTSLANGFLKFQWPSTESYCTTIDGRLDGENNSLTYEQYKTSARRLRGHNTGFPTGSGSFDNFPDAHLDSLHEDCPDLNTENKDVQQYLLNAYYRYIDMGVDMFRVDTVMHIHKETLNEMYWPQLLARAEQSKDARGGADFFIFGEVANFVNNLDDKPARLQQSHYTWDESVVGQGNSNNHLLDGNNYRTPDYSKKAPNGSSPYHVSVIDIISHNGFCDGVQGAYGRALSTSSAYNDATFLTWYTDSHDYGPNKGETRWAGDFKAAWSMLFTFRGIPIVYYGSEIRFAQGKPNDWPGGGGGGVNMSLEKTGRAYFGAHLEGTVTATDFGEYTASGAVNTTLSSDESQHLMRLNKIRLAVPALQMGQYSTDGCSGGWAAFKRRYTGTNKITGEKIDSYAIVGVGAGSYNFTGILDGKYIDCVTGDVKQVSGGSMSFSVPGDDSNLRVYVLDGLATKAPGQVITKTSSLY